MQRREFSRSLLSAGACLSLAGVAGQAMAQRIGYKEGADYQRLAKPAAVAASAGQIEVVEFFAYSCIHCYRFEPLLEAWVKKLPTDVKLRRLPAAFSPARPSAPSVRSDSSRPGGGASFPGRGPSSPSARMAWLICRCGRAWR